MVEFTGLQIFSLVSFSIIFLFGSIGNLLVIYVYGFGARRRFMKFERLMLMLGIFDFVASITNPAYFIYDIAYDGVWHLGAFTCRVIPALGPIFTGISLAIILIMAVDRDRAVCTPFKKQFHVRTIYKIVALTVLLCVIVTIPYIYYRKFEYWEGDAYCYPDSNTTYNVMIVVIFMFSDLIFLSVFITTTYRVFNKLKKKDIIDCPTMREHRARETNRILKIITAMGVMFVLCVFPRDLLMITFSFDKLFPPHQINFETATAANTFLKVLHTCNSCVNVVLYSLLNRKFRKEVLRVLMRNPKFRTFYTVRYPDMNTDSYDSSFNRSTITTINSNTNSLERRNTKGATASLLKQVLTKQEMETKH